MKIQIRRGVFETNSSSTHSLSIFKTDEWERFKKGEMVIENYPYESNLVDIKDVAPEDIYNPDSDADEDWWDKKYYLYRDLDDIGYYENLFKKVNEYTVMSTYGSDV